MKKYIILSILSTSFSSQLVNAQVDRDNIFLGGSLGFSKQNINDPANYGSEYSVSETSFSPRLGFGLSGNWIFGGAIGYEGSKYSSDYTQINEVKSRTYLAGLFVRKFYPFKEQFGFFGEAEVNYGFGKTTKYFISGASEVEKMQEYSISAHPGIYFKPTRKFFIEASIGDLSYTHTKTTPPDGPKGTNKKFNFSLTNGLTFGLFFIL